MKKNNKKGFTIVELVIVIAVIAILSAVLIPTFSSVIGNAQNTARDQEASNVYKQYLEEFDYTKGSLPVKDGYLAYVKGDVTYYYTIENGQIDLDSELDAKDKPVAKPADCATTAKATVGTSSIYELVVADDGE